MHEELQLNNMKAKLHLAKYNTSHTSFFRLMGVDKDLIEWKKMKDSDI